ncbi:hypothetical protein C8Q76DRAFT_758853 [Earliella scabrosa]|nr:hypothetical protein C8Q76DRAFT_758853 [Earliella scabrosa]
MKAECRQRSISLALAFCFFNVALRGLCIAVDVYHRIVAPAATCALASGWSEWSPPKPELNATPRNAELPTSTNADCGASPMSTRSGAAIASHTLQARKPGHAVISDLLMQ